jgi:hypothetical protein
VGLLTPLKVSTAKDFLLNYYRGVPVTKQELQRLVREYGDAIITYKSDTSNKRKYNVCTLDFSTPYIKAKASKAIETEDTLLLYSWDADGFRLLKPSKVLTVVPLASVLNNV